MFAFEVLLISHLRGKSENFEGKISSPNSSETNTACMVRLIVIILAMHVYIYVCFM